MVGGRRKQASRKVRSRSGQQTADGLRLALKQERVQRKEALAQHAATAEILHSISAAQADATPVFEAIARNAHRLCRAAFCNVLRYDGERIHVAATHGFSPQETAKVRAKYPVTTDDRSVLSARVILSCKPEFIADVYTDSQYDRSHVIARALFGVPMLHSGVPVGAIVMGLTRPGRVPKHQQDLLQTFADQAVIAIENARLFQELQARNRELTESLEQQTATGEILRVISSSPTELAPVFEAVAKSVSRLCDAPDVVIAQADGEVMRFGASVGPFGRTFGPNLTVPIRRGSVAGRAVLERRTIQVHDLAAEPDDEYPEGKAIQRRYGHRTMVAAPLLLGDTALGAIAMLRQEVRPFSTKQLALLRTFADQAVIAIENVRLFNETKEALERQTATAEILKVISKSPSDIQPVFDAVAESAARLCDATDVILRRIEDGGVLRAVTHIGSIPLPAEVVALPVSPKSAAGRAVIERRTMHIHDVTDESVRSEYPEAAFMAQRGTGFRTLLIVPLVRNDVAVGLIAVRREEKRPFSDQQIGLLQTFADQAVIAVENVRLFNETKEALEQQTAISEVLRVISSSPADVQPVLEAVAVRAARICDATDVRIFLAEADELRHVAGFGDVPLTAERFALDRGSTSGRAVVDRMPVHVHDILAEPDGAYPISRDIALRIGWRTALSVPLIRENRALGAILLRRLEVRPFSEKQIALLKTFSDQAAIAIENVRLFKELQERTEALTKSVGQLTALGEVGQAISSTLELETVLKTIVSRAVQLSNMDGGSIYEYDERAEEFRLQAAENMSADVVDDIRKAPTRKGDGALGHTAMTLEPTQVPDTLDDSYRSARKELLIRAGYRALLAVPLLREGHLLGALLVNRKTPGPFAPEVVDLLKTFAMQSALAIQNARLFREIAEKGRQLEVASHHKSQFLASMSHELRTPLNAILGFNEMLLDQVYGELSEDVKAPLENMQASGKHLLRLINNVLDLAKIEAGRMELALSDYSVQDTVESVRSTLRPLAAEKGLEFLANVPADIPLAYGDAGRIMQCLMNLAGNSLKFTKEGRVEISVQQQNGLLRYCVADTGIGIPPDKIGSLFTEFKQTDATIASEYGGTGLGLSITKKFIEMHGGRIWVESEPGTGSTFTFEVPLRAGERKAA
ncbi:MAG TPA: GAF domain-containing protein [Burkholderiales bacterium]|nr:GAF domain-containing protein [Burkholderiales bacterium]